MASAVGWSALSEVFSRVVTPVAYLILARYLTPEDFGIVAAALVVIALSDVLATAGLPRSLIQTNLPDPEVDELSDSAFWANLALGAIVAGTLVASAEVIGGLFGEHRSGPVIRALAGLILIGSLAAVPQARFERSLAFKPLFLARVLGALASAVIALVGVALGMGYWALVVGALAGGMARAIPLWALSPWRPSWHPNLRRLRHLVPMATWLTLEGLLVWAFTWSDTAVVGLYLETDALGLYRFSAVVATTLLAAALGPLQQVLFSGFSRLQDKPEVLDSTFRVASKVMALVSLPIGVGLLIMGVPIAEVVLPAVWSEAGPVLGILGLTYGLALIIGAHDARYRAIGRPDVYVLVMAGSLPVYLVSFAIAAQAGLDVLLITRLLLVCAGLIVQIAVAGRVLAFGFSKTAANLWRVLLACSVMAAVTLVARESLAPIETWQVVAAIVLLGVVSYFIALLALERSLLRRMWGMVTTRS